MRSALPMGTISNPCWHSRDRDLLVTFQGKRRPVLTGRTAYRATWTCQEGSGSLLGNFVQGLVFGRVRGFILYRCLR